MRCVQASLNGPANCMCVWHPARCLMASLPAYLPACLAGVGVLRALLWHRWVWVCACSVCQVSAHDMAARSVNLHCWSLQRLPARAAPKVVCWRKEGPITWHTITYLHLGRQTCAGATPGSAAWLWAVGTTRLPHACIACKCTGEGHFRRHAVIKSRHCMCPHMRATA